MSDHEVNVVAKRRNRGVLAALIGVLVAGGAALGVWLQPFGDGTPPLDELASPAATAVPLAGVAASQLTAGVCMTGFQSAWDARFEVVDCEAPHDGQLLAIVEAQPFAADSSYPGEEALRQRAQLSCQAPEILDTTAAAGIPGLLIEASYPLSQEAWDAGERSYRCFASTPNDTTGSLAANS